MMKQLSVVGTLCAAMAGLLSSGSAQAALVDRGRGMLYDTVLNITWLQDANYAKTSNYDADGRMEWTRANIWANGLVYGGYSDWRLARNSPVNGTQAGWNYTYSTDGSTDVSYNISDPRSAYPGSVASELAFMYYVNLGFKGFYSTDSFEQPDHGVFRDGRFGGQKDVGLVKNLQNAAYWSGTTSLSPADYAWAFGTSYGYQTISSQSNAVFAWAVHDGDIAAVPVPGTVALLAGGVALLGVVTRRRGRIGASGA